MLTAPDTLLCQTYRVTCTFRKITGGELRTFKSKCPEDTYAIWYRRGHKARNHGTTAFVPIRDGVITFRHSTVIFHCTASKSVFKATCEPKPLRLTLLQRPAEGGDLVPIGTEMCVDLSKYMSNEKFQKEFWFPYFVSENATTQLFILISVEPLSSVMNIQEAMDMVCDTTVGSVGSDDEEGALKGDVVRKETPGLMETSTTLPSKGVAGWIPPPPPSDLLVVKERVLELQESQTESRVRLAESRRISRERQRAIEQLELENNELKIKVEKAGLQVAVERKRLKMLMTKGDVAMNHNKSTGADCCMSKNPCSIS